MENRKGVLEVVAVVLAVVTCPAVATGQDGTASGTLTLNGKAIQLKHAYASAQPGFFDTNAEDVRVLLSDAPLPETALADQFELVRLGRQGTAHVVEVILNAKGAPLTGAIFAPHFKGMASLAGMHEFDVQRLDRTGIAGRLFMNGTRSFMEATYHYEAQFSAAIPRPPTAEELAAALASPPAQAASAHLAAIRRGQLAAFLTTLSAAAAADYRGPDGADRLRLLRSEMPADTRVVQVQKQPDGRVKVGAEGHQNGIVIGYTFVMVLEGGAWKVGK